MLKINKIKFVINTTGGLFGSSYAFNNGLNIVRANNTSGKSSLFQAITYCLGFEEIIGGRNEKTMQSVFRDQVEYPKDSFHSVIQSFVFLEFENGEGEIATVKRSVISNERKPQLVDVFFGEIIDNPDHTLESHPMYIHDKGGASDDTYGFHYFLETFLGWSLPTVLTVTGDERKLYLQQIASAFLIEQKSGWSDFFATMPHYALASKEARTVEFLLSLDVTENKKRKQQITYEKRLLEDKWEILNKQIISFVQKGGGRLLELSPKPLILNGVSNLKIVFSKDDEEISMAELISSQIEELNLLQGKTIRQSGENISENEAKLEKYSNYVDRLALNYEMIATELNFDRDKLRSYKSQLDFLKEDLRKNKGALKVQNMGSDHELKTAAHSCPTCSQGIPDSLLPLEVEQTPMRLEDNIEFIDAQAKMIKVYIEGQEKTISEKERKLDQFKESLSTARAAVRQIKRELVADDRIPSVQQIEEQLNLKKRIEFYNKYAEDFSELQRAQNDLSAQWEDILTKEKNLPAQYFSSDDMKKVDFLESNFKSLLQTFHYQSQEASTIHISHENYFPVIRKYGDATKDYDIRFDSSGSDFIRCIWAYTFALMNTSVKYNGKHPQLVMMDEPKQQDCAMEDFHKFLKTISNYDNCQTIIFASFENSDEAFEVATKDIDFNLIYLSDRLIIPA